MAASAAQRCTANFSGHVQGVGFRYTTCSIARRYEVTGFVRNLPNGEVELVAEGACDELEAFLREVRDHLGSHIRKERSDTQPATGEFQGFRISY